MRKHYEDDSTLFDDDNTLFDAAEGAQRKIEGMEKAEHFAQADVVKAMWATWRQACEMHAEVTTDHFWALLSATMRHHVEQHSNVIGKMVAESAQRNWVRSTGRSVNTRRPSGQGRKITVWKSLIYRANA